MRTEWLASVDWLATFRLIALFGLLAAIGWLGRKWRRVELALEGEAPSGADAYLSLFLAALIFMTVALVAVVLLAPELSRLWPPSSGGGPGIGDLVNQYSAGLNLLFSIPTALAGSVVAIVLALRTLKSADDVKQITEQQTTLMQEQNRLQEEQIRLGTAQAFVEQRQIVLAEIDAIQSRYFELCDALNGYLAVARRNMFAFWEGQVSGLKSEALTSRLEDCDFNEFSVARERVFSSLKAVAAHPVSFRLWRKLAKAADLSMLDDLQEQASCYTFDKLPTLRLGQLPSLINTILTYRPANSPSEANSFINRKQALDAELDHVWRASHAASLASKWNAVLGHSLFRSDGKSYSLEIERLERTMRSSWECPGESMHSSYLEATCLPAALRLSDSDVKVLNALLAEGLKYIPESHDALNRHLELLSHRINEVLGEQCVNPKDWLNEIEEGAMQDRGDLLGEARDRAYLVAAGALLSSFEGHDFHNIGVAFLADVVCALPNRTQLLQCIGDEAGAEFQATLKRLDETGVIGLDIQSFIPVELRAAAEWLREHPVQALTTSFCACTGGEFDQMFEHEKWLSVVDGDDRQGMFRALGLQLGSVQC